MSKLLKLERQIASVGADDVIRRWRYGAELSKAKAGKRKLPDGLIDDLIAAAERDGLKVSRREIQYRVRLAEVYASEAQLRKIVCTIGPWSEIIAAGFPAIEIDEEPGDLELAAPDEWEQLSLIPGLGETIKVNGRRIPLAEATVADIAAYRDMYAQIHANYEKRLALIEAALGAMRDGSSDDSENAIDAYKRGTGSAS